MSVLRELQYVQIVSGRRMDHLIVVNGNQVGVKTIETSTPQLVVSKV